MMFKKIIEFFTINVFEMVKGNMAMIALLLVLIMGYSGIKFGYERNTDNYTIVNDVLPCTAYTWADDDKQPGDDGYGIAFTGVKATADHVIAVDPIYWSQRLGLEYDHEWPQEKRAKADVFWKTIWWDVENEKVYFARDIGGAIKQKRIDISFGDTTPQTAIRLKMFGKQYRRFIVIVNKDKTAFDMADEMNKMKNREKNMKVEAGHK